MDGPLPTSVGALLSEALGIGQQLTERYPNVADAHEVYARIQYNVGCIGEAEASWRRALELAPNYAYAIHGLGLVAAKRCDFQAAADYQGQALALMPELDDAVRYGAKAHLRLGDAERAIEMLQDYLALQPEDTKTTVHLGQAQLAAGRYEQARQTFASALETHPDIPRAQYGLTLALARLKEDDRAHDARETYRKIRKHKRQETYRERQREGDFNRHARQLSEHYVSASRLYLSRQQIEVGAALCRRAAKMAPSDVESRQLFISVAPRLEQFDEALEVCSELVELEPENTGHRLNLGALHEHAGEISEAQRIYEALIEREPEQARGHAALVRLHLQQQEHEKAISHAREATRKEPSPHHFVLLAQTLAESGKLDDAATAIERAIELDPNNPEWRRLKQLIERELP